MQARAPLPIVVRAIMDDLGPDEHLVPYRIAARDTAPEVAAGGSGDDGAGQERLRRRMSPELAVRSKPKARACGLPGGVGIALVIELGPG